MRALRAPRKKLHIIEFIALTGTLFAFVAFSIDALLPALPEIASELVPDTPNTAQLVISAFVIGLGIGTLFSGPLSDALGRRPVILGGIALYITGSLIAWSSTSIELIFLGRLIQGLGASGPRVAALAVVRDLYSGRKMAQIVSFAMIVFTLFPAIAPLIGSFIISAFGWRAIFVAFVLFGLLGALWNGLRQPETLPPENRKQLSLDQLRQSAAEVLTTRSVVVSIAVQSLIFGMLFGVIATIQPSFDRIFDRGESFPYWFALIAIISGVPSMINAALVVRFGMRRMVRGSLLVQICLTGIATILFVTTSMPQNTLFILYFIWTLTLFSTMGFTVGNLNALALQPMGGNAGMATSIMGSISTLAGGLLGAPIGLMFNDTPIPMSCAALFLFTCAWLMFRLMPDEPAT